MKRKFERRPLTGRNILDLFGVKKMSEISDQNLLSLIEQGLMVAGNGKSFLVTYVWLDTKQAVLVLKNTHSENTYPCVVDLRKLDEPSGFIFSVKNETEE